MTYSIKSLGFGQVAVLKNGKHVKKFGGASAPTDARMFINQQHQASLPKDRAPGMKPRKVAEEMESINNNIGKFTEDMLEGFTEDEINEMIEKYEGFGKLEGELKAKGAKDPEALAAWIGRKKYGKKKFQAKAASARNEDWEPEKETKEPEAKDDAKLKKDAKKNKEALDKISDSFAKLKNEEVEDLEERNKTNATKRKTMDAARGSMWRNDNKIADATIRDWDNKHPTKQAQNKAIGRALRNEEAEYIEEKLTAKDPSGKWISDFVKSDNPKFAGKSKEERIKMALGAYYGAQKESVDEDAYSDHRSSSHQHYTSGYKAHGTGKSRQDNPYKEDSLAAKHWAKGWEHSSDGKKPEQFTEEANLGNEGEFKKSKQSFKKASKQDKQGNPVGSLEVTSEEFVAIIEAIDQLDELSKETLGKYVKKASKKAVGHWQSGLAKGDRGDISDAGTQFHKSLKRQKGIEKAVNRLTKEACEIVEQFEQLDELKKSTLASYIDKAAGGSLKGVAYHAWDAGSKAVRNDREGSKKAYAKAQKRSEGIQTAAKKLAKESFADFLFDGEVIHEDVEFVLEADTGYDAYFKACMKKAGISSIADLKSDEEKKEFMNKVDAGFKAKNEEVVLEQMLKPEVEDKIQDHRKMGNKVDDVFHGSRSGKPYSEFVVTTPDGTKKKYVFHGNVTRHEKLA